MRERVRGFYGIGVYNPKHECNHNTIYRSAMNFRADYIFNIGGRYKATKADTCKSWRHCPFFQWPTWDDFIISRPRECVIVAVEMAKNAHSLYNFVHPDRAVYVLGSEDTGLPDHILRDCDVIVKIPTLTVESLNVAACGSILMWDRFYKRSLTC